MNQTTNQTIQELLERKSVRVYTEQEITEEKKEKILLAAMAAPTAGNMQLYTIIDVQKQEIKDRLSVLCDNQPFIASAKMILVFCADYKKWYDVFKISGADPRNPGVGDLVLAIADACIAAQNAVTAAQSLGIGSCYIGDVKEQCESMRECLNLPEFVFPACMLVFGYPTRQQMERTKPERCRMEDIVCKDQYQVKNEMELRRMFEKECKNRSFEEWAQAFCTRKYNSDFSKEMTRSVTEYLKDYENGNAELGVRRG